METLNEGRVGIGARMVGSARGAVDHTPDCVKERQQFGRSVTGFQGVRLQLAEMATRVEAARLLVYNAARPRDEGERSSCPPRRRSSAPPRRPRGVASRCVDLHGGYGFTREHPVETCYRDSRIGTIYEGTTKRQLETIAKTLLR